QIAQPPSPGAKTQMVLTTKGRLSEVEDYEKVIVKRDREGRIVRIRDIATVRLGPRVEDINNRFGIHGEDTRAAVGLAVFALPDANALETADLIKAKMEELKKDFPEGIDYRMSYDTTPFIRESIREVFKSLRDAVLLVALVVLLFLQSWRSAIIP